MITRIGDDCTRVQSYYSQDGIQGEYPEGDGRFLFM